jgi:hypothetical protein
MAEYLQPCPAAFVVGLPAARACQLPGSGLPATHGHYHAVASHLARSKIPVRSSLPYSGALAVFEEQVVSVPRHGACPRNGYPILAAHLQHVRKNAPGDM